MKTIISFLFFAIFILSCSNDSENEEKTIINYYGTSSSGNIVTLGINKTDNAYIVNNSVTQQEQTFPITLQNNELSGILQVTDAGKNFYGIELPGKMFFGNFPSGNQSNTLFCGVTQADYSDKALWIAGDYVFFKVTNQLIKEWGVITFFLSGAIKQNNYTCGSATGNFTNLAPENFNTPLPLNLANFTGNWSFQNANPYRITYHVNEDNKDYTCFVYATSAQVVLCIDLGASNGFLFAIKNIPSTSINQLAGIYKFTGSLENQTNIYRNAGNVMINSASLSSISMLNQQGNISQIQTSVLLQNGYLKNLLYGNSTSGGVNRNIYFLSSGELLFMAIFTVSNNIVTFEGYGIGAKI